MLKKLFLNNPCLEICKKDIEDTFNILISCFSGGGKLLVCGNGGSAADSDHIVGELLKGFLKKRPLNKKLTDGLKGIGYENIAERLQMGLPAINLCAQSAIISAVSNDLGGELIYAQQVCGYGREGDVFLGISTSGNAENIANAIAVSKALGIKTIGLTGGTGGRMKEMCDVCICVPKSRTPDIQELHLPVYHTLCAMVEEHFFVK